MNDLVQFLSHFSFWEVCLIAMACIIIILKVIEGAKKLWEKRQNFKDAAVLEGERIQREMDDEEREKESYDKKIKELQDELSSLMEIISEQRQQIALLLQSDELDIKAWIKNQHEKWIALQCIDSQSLELICQRFSIYTQEGGNSWAEKLVEEIKALPVVIVIPAISQQ